MGINLAPVQSRARCELLMLSGKFRRLWVSFLINFCVFILSYRCGESKSWIYLISSSLFDVLYNLRDVVFKERYLHIFQNILI